MGLQQGYPLRVTTTVFQLLGYDLATTTTTKIVATNGYDTALELQGSRVQIPPEKYACDSFFTELRVYGYNKNLLLLLFSLGNTPLRPSDVTCT